MPSTWEWTRLEFIWFLNKLYSHFQEKMHQSLEDVSRSNLENVNYVLSTRTSGTAKTFLVELSVYPKEVSKVHRQFIQKRKKLYYNEKKNRTVLYISVMIYLLIYVYLFRLKQATNVFSCLSIRPTSQIQRHLFEVLVWLKSGAFSYWFYSEERRPYT